MLCSCDNVSFLFCVAESLCNQLEQERKARMSLQHQLKGKPHNLYILQFSNLCEIFDKHKVDYLYIR